MSRVAAMTSTVPSRPGARASRRNSGSERPLFTDTRPPYDARVGFFQNLVNSFGSAVGAVDDRLLANGLLGRADVLGVEMSGMTVQIMNGLVERDRKSVV